MKQGKKPGVLVIILAAMLLISLVANGVLAVMLSKERNDPSRSLYDPEYAVGGDETIVTMETTEPAENAQIDTEYIQLTVPEDIVDRVVVTRTEDENGAAITFSSTFSGKELTLFSVILTKEETTDYTIGTLQLENGEFFYVTMNMNEQNPSEWTEEEYNEICSLQERVNDIIVQFYEDERFVPSR